MEGGVELLTVRLEPELAERLSQLAEATGRSKSHYVRQAIEEFLEERADYLVALSVLEENQPTIGLDQLRRELGI
ncbi:MAG TPA: ribbon-helix-helix domain-containing protein [Trueperaceae bacterium]|nr:ribbon-helix-helix domain-containing protein [Trueperaceae bacterium]